MAVTLLGYDEGREKYQRRLVFWIGEYYPTYFLVVGENFEAAMDLVFSFVSEWMPGYFIQTGSDEYWELMEDANPAARTLTDEAGWQLEESAFADHSNTEQGFLLSHEWGLALDNPGREDLKSFLEEHGGVDWERATSEGTTAEYEGMTCCVNKTWGSIWFSKCKRRGVGDRHKTPQTITCMGCLATK